MNEEESLGFKKLTLENYLSPDNFNKYFIRRNFITGEEKEISANDRAELFLKFELSKAAPINVRRQFETARGAMLYGYYFYPLFALGADQLLRVAESAITHKCLSLSLTRKDSSYLKKLNQLLKNKIINSQEFNEWKNLKDLRNDFSHSTIQTQFPHWEAALFLKIITEKINNLFQI